MGMERPAQVNLKTRLMQKCCREKKYEHRTVERKLLFKVEENTF